MDWACSRFTHAVQGGAVGAGRHVGLGEQCTDSTGSLSAEPTETYS